MSWSVQADVTSEERYAGIIKYIFVTDIFAAMREQQISVNTRTRPERYLVHKHVARTNKNIFAFTCCVHPCYLDNEIMGTREQLVLLTD